MLIRTTRWTLIVAPVIAGILVLIFGTAGSISTTFGIVLIGLGPTIWMWNWFIRMSFEEPEDPDLPQRQQPPQDPHHDEHRPPRRSDQRTAPDAHHPPRQLERPRRRRR